jgi:LacI family transcriptional regulator
MEFIEIHARSYGYNILLSTIDEKHSLKPQIDHITELNLKGAIIFATEMNDEDMKDFKNLQIPIVAIDNDFSRLSFNTVSINNIMGTFQAIEHLVKMNHYRIGYLKSNIRISSFDERKKGYESALEYFNLTFSSSDILEVRYTEEGSYQDIKGYLDRNKSTKLPSAFVCDDDTIAVGALRAFTEHGYKIPEDVSIIGFNDRNICEVTSPPLTTISIPKHTFAVEAVDELIRLIENKDRTIANARSRKIRIGTKLMVRKSVRFAEEKN